MKLTRILAGFLALLMLIGSLAACGENTEDPANSDAVTTAPIETEPETELTDWLPDDLHYDGAEITIISRYREGWTSGENTVVSQYKSVTKQAERALNTMTNRFDRILSGKTGR